jgi:hypothetical protein
MTPPTMPSRSTAAAITETLREVVIGAAYYEAAVYRSYTDFMLS